jgi:septal ring factor EnvC (AmiA/AmiB activator)
MWATSPGHAWAQDELESLKLERRKLEKKVRLTEQLIRQTQKVKQKSFFELNLLRRQVQMREQLVSFLGDEVKEISMSIERLDGLINAMEGDIDRIQKNFGRVAYVTYKSQSNLSVLLWIVSSNSFTQAYNRLMYFRKFSQYRKRQIAIIRRTRNYIGLKRKVASDQRAEKENLLVLRMSERENLQQASRQKDQLLRQLRTREDEYRTELKGANRRLAEVRAKLIELIRRGRNEENREVVTALSSNFERNQGKLPWPLPMQNGIITGTFGRSVDESGGEVVNDGIFITTTEGMQVRAIFEGKVTAVSTLPVVGKVVIVQHGRYRSVYANLDEIFVKEGDKLETVSLIGTVKTNPRTGESKLHFLLYRDYEPVNPMNWIQRKG